MSHTFQLEDLTCPSCVKKIEKALRSIKGVSSVDVRFNASKVIVTSNNNIDVNILIQTIESVGFKVIHS